MGNVFGIMSERFSILQNVKTNTFPQAQMIRRISKVTLQSIVIGSVALLP